MIRLRNAPIPKKNESRLVSEQSLLGDYTTLDELRSIKIPVHLLLGERTLPLLHNINNGLAREIPGARLWPIPGRKHMDVVVKPV